MIREKEPITLTSARSLQLLQGSLSTRKIARHSPMVAGFHRVVDGILIGACVAMTVITTLTLHWQHRWTVSFSKLEITRSLLHRLTESTASLESHLLNRKTMPQFMVPLRVSNLLYLDDPFTSGSSSYFDSSKSLFKSKLFDDYISHGY